MILNQIFAASSGTTDLVNPQQWALDWFGGRKTTAGENVGPDTAMALPAYYACVRALAEDEAKLPFITYERLDDGGKQRAERHHVYPLLHHSPNPEMTAAAFRETVTAHAAGWGNGYAEIEFNGAGVPIALWPIHPSRVTPKRDRGGMLFYDVRFQDLGRIEGAQGLRTVPIAAREMLHIHGLGDNGITGFAASSIGREAIGVGIAQQKYSGAFFGNSAMPAAAYKPPKMMDTQAKQAMRAAWGREFGGAERSGGFAVLDPGGELTTFSIDPKKAQMIEARQYTVEDIARLFRMPPHKIQHLLRATFCLPAGTAVFTTRGPVPIESVDEGEVVWSYDGSEMVPARVSATGLSGRDEILRISARGAVVRCTAGHRVLVRRETLEPFEGGRGQCVIKDGRRWRRAWEETYIRAEEIIPGDSLVAPLRVPDPRGDDTGTRKATVEFCEHIGHHLGDGFLARARGYPSVIGFSHAENESSRQYYANVLETVFAERSDMYSRERILTNVPVARRRDATTTVLYNGSAVREMEALGVAGTAHEKRLPRWVFGLKLELRLAVLRGYLDSDGTVKRGGYASFASVNRVLLDGMRHLAIGCGLRAGRITTTTTNNTFGGAEHTLHTFGITRPEDVLRVGSHKTEYIARASQRVAGRHQRSRDLYPHERAARGFDSPCVRYMKVMSIEREPAEDVYDLTVDGTHSFVADGVIVHNSNIEEQSLEYVSDTLMPWLVRWEQEVRRKLFVRPADRSFFAEHLVDALLRGNAVARAQANQIKLMHGALTPDEWRAQDNANPLPDGLGAKHYIPVNLKAIEDDDKEPEQAAPPPDRGEGEEDDARGRASTLALCEDACSRIVAKEDRALRRLMEKHAGDATSFNNAVVSFYARHRAMVLDVFEKVVAIECLRRGGAPDREALIGLVDRELAESSRQIRAAFVDCSTGVELAEMAHEWRQDRSRALCAIILPDGTNGGRE